MIFSNNLSSSRSILLKQNVCYDYNFPTNHSFDQILKIVQMSLQICQKCKVKKKNHFCIEQNCNKKQLICPQCHTTSIQSQHYMHDYSFILPLLSKDVFYNFNMIKKKITQFHTNITDEINKIQEYLKDLIKLQQIAKRQIQKLCQQQINSKAYQYINKISDFFNEQSNEKYLKDIINNVTFYSSKTCKRKQKQFKSELQTHINNLKWPKDPQKTLKDKLKLQFQIQSKQIFLPIHKTIQISQVDAYFKANNQYLTDNLKNSPLLIRLQNQIFGKNNKFYQSFIYHFRQCKKIIIQNGNINNLRTPLTFRNLKQLQFIFNMEAQPQNIKIQQCNARLNCLTFKKIRQQDLKILKLIMNSCQNLYKIHLQINNKTDSSYLKQVIDFLRPQQMKKITNFVLKARTQNDMKRMFGYLSKYTRQSNEIQQQNYSFGLIKNLQNCKYLSKLTLQGIKFMDVNLFYTSLKQFKFLLQAKVTYDGIDILNQIDKQQIKILQDTCLKRKKTFYGLVKVQKFKRIPSNLVEYIFTQMLI